MFGSVLGVVMAWVYIYARSRDRIRREGFRQGYREARREIFER